MCWFNKTKFTTVKQVVEKCKENPRKILSWIGSNIWYISDKENHGVDEYWQTPTETLTGIYIDGKKGKPYSGDCDDFSILAQKCLEQVGIMSHLITVHTPTEYAGTIPRKWKGHAVIALQLDNKWYHFSNWGLKFCRNAKSLKDVAPYVFKKGYWQECWISDGTIKRGQIYTF